MERVGRLAALSVVAAALVASCRDHADPNIVARVSERTDSHVCLVPEAAADEKYGGCFGFAEADAKRLVVGTCVHVRVPSPYAPNASTRRVTHVRGLGRSCRR
jgi:hypothetical protein